MALTYTPIPTNPQAGSPGDSSRASVGNIGSLKVTLTSITLDGSYAAGGVVLDPKALGFQDAVQFGLVNVRTAVAVASPGGGALDCSTPASPKLKLQAAGNLAELANGAGTGAVVDVLAFGY